VSDTPQEQQPRAAADRHRPPGSDLHNMGGGSGPASVRGSHATPGGYAHPTGYVAGCDDDWPETAGSDEKSVAARTDEVQGNQDTFGPSPQRVPETAGSG
jgi:hypothetical protein